MPCLQLAFAQSLSLYPFTRKAIITFKSHVRSFTSRYACPTTPRLKCTNHLTVKNLTGFLCSIPNTTVEATFRQLCDKSFCCHAIELRRLWILYQTILFEWMHTFRIVNVAVHVHLFIAGFVFTSSILYIDPVPHRFSFRFRALVMILGFTLHSILSKIIYSASLPGVPIADAKQGAVFMYYGGDLIDACLIGAFCFQWYRKSMVHVPLNESLSNT